MKYENEQEDEEDVSRVGGEFGVLIANFDVRKLKEIIFIEGSKRDSDFYFEIIFLRVQIAIVIYEKI